MDIKRRLFVWNARQYGRMAFVLVFAAIGGFYLGRAAPDLLTKIYELSSRNAKPSDDSIQAFRRVVSTTVSILPLALIGAMLGAFIGNLILNGTDRLVQMWDRMHTGDKVTLYLGAFAGIIMSVPVLLI